MTCNTEIKFSEDHTAMAIKWLVECIAELADLESVLECIGKLSVILTVMRRCHEVAKGLK